jgi:hypothetical protein
MPLTEAVFRSDPSIGGGESTGRWILTKKKTSTDAAESSALHPEAGGAGGLTQSSHAAQQPRGGGEDSGMGGRSYAESSSSSSSTSSSESLDSSAPLREHSREFLVHGNRHRVLGCVWSFDLPKHTLGKEFHYSQAIILLAD